jgi:geranylgeranyl reductase family protein
MISIIGAGPAGSYLAYLLAKKSKEVAIFEEHKDIGKPVQCTGIVTEDIKDLIKLDYNLICNITTKATIHSKNKIIEINTKEIVLDREKFDNYLLNLALKAGAKLYKGYKYEKFDGKTIFFSNGKNFDTDILIGADGPNSAVAKTNGLFDKRDFYIGIQARVRLKADPNNYQVFFGNDFPGFFGWIVPESNNIARVGIAAKQYPNAVFNNFIKRLKLSKASIIEKQGGLIPIYSTKQKIQNGNVFLIGDA